MLFVNVQRLRKKEKKGKQVYSRSKTPRRVGTCPTYAAQAPSRAAGRAAHRPPRGAPLRGPARAAGRAAHCAPWGAPRAPADRVRFRAARRGARRGVPTRTELAARRFFQSTSGRAELHITEEETLDNLLIVSYTSPWDNRTRAAGTQNSNRRDIPCL